MENIVTKYKSLDSMMHLLNIHLKYRLVSALWWTDYVMQDTGTFFIGTCRHFLCVVWY